MNIIIPIKQVPETANVKMDPKTGTMIRSGVQSIVNPLDLYAIEAGIAIREKTGGEVTAITMGPAKAEDALKEAIAMGCDNAILLSDKKFAGADTWSTSYVLSQAIKKMNDFSIIICGERATDGDTGQVGPGIAAWLDIPVCTYVSRVEKILNNSIILERMVEDGYERLEVPFPCVLTVVKEIAYPRLPTLRGKQKARLAQIPLWGPLDLAADDVSLGLKGSPTRVVKITSSKISRNGRILKPGNTAETEEAVDELIGYLKKREIL